MSPEITAKIRCQSKQESGANGARQVLLTFVADYEDGRNKEWALYTPVLNLQMSVRGDVADRFEAGQSFTLTFAPEETP